MQLCGAVAFAALAAAGSSIPWSDGIDFSRLQKPIINQPEVFKQAIQIISNLEDAPSCHRLATRSLLESCQSLTDEKSSDSNTFLDQVKSVFAARLAVCELRGANAAIPTQCLAMVPKSSAEERKIRCLLPGSHCEQAKEASSKLKFNFEEMSQHHVEHCLNILESRPQWWTSYSNARQNAVVICQAARSEAEREQLLEVHKEMAKVSSDLSEAISRTSQQSSEYLMAQAAFAQQIQRLQADVVGDVTAGRVEVQGLLYAMAGQVETFFNDAFVRFKSSSTQAAASMDDLDSRIKESADEVVTAQYAIKNSMASIQLEHEALAMSQRENSEFTSNSALDVQKSLATIRSQQIEPIELALKGLHALIDAQTQLMRLMYEKQGSMDERLSHFNDTINGLQIRASIAEGSMNSLFENLTSQMLATNDLASAIKMNLDEVGKKLTISVLGFFNPFMRGWPVFPLAVAFLSYLIFGAHVARRITVIGVVSYAFMVLYKQLKSIELIWPDSAYSIRDVLAYLCISIALLASLTMFCIIKSRTHRTQQTLEHVNLCPDNLWARKKCPTTLPMTPNYSV